MVAPFFHEMAKNANYPPPLQPAFPGGPQSDSHKVYQTCLSEGAGLAWAHIKQHMHGGHVHARTHTHIQTQIKFQAARFKFVRILGVGLNVVSYLFIYFLC